MINSTLKKLNRAATAVVAAATLVLTTFAGATGADASTPNANSNIGMATVTMPYTPGQGTTVPGAGFGSMRWTFQTSIDTQAWDGKTLSATGSISASSGTVSSNVVGYVSYFSDISSQYSSASGWGTIFSSGGGDNLVVPTGTKRISISWNVGMTDNMGIAVAPIQGATYTPTVQLKVDGTAQTLSTVLPNTDATLYHLTNSANVTIAARATSIAGNANYTQIFHQAYTCVDVSGMTADSTLTIHPVLNGVDKTGDNSFWTSFEYRGLGAANGGYNYLQNSTLTVTSAMISAGVPVLVHSYKTINSATDPNTNYSYELSVQDSSNNEVSTACALPAPSAAPVMSQNGNYLAVSVTDSAFANKNWTWNLYKASDNSLLATGTGYGNTGNSTINTCGMSGCVSPVAAGVQVYTKVSMKDQLANENGLLLNVTGLESPASNTIALPDPWIAVQAPSGGSGAGEARQVAANIDYAAAMPASNMNMSSQQYTDGKNGVLKAVLKVLSEGDMNTPPTLEYRLFRLGATGIDTSFAGAGANGLSIPASSNSSYANVGWYGNRDKWTFVDRRMGYGSTPTTYVITNGNFANSTKSSPITISGTDLNAFCVGVSGTGATANGIFPLSSTTASPVYSINCFKSVAVTGGNYNATSSNYVKISSNGALTAIASLNVGDGATDTGWATIAAVTNVNASAASDIAFTIIGYASKMSAPTGSAAIVERKEIRIKVDGSATTVANPWTSTATTNSTEKMYVFPRYSAGLAVTGFQRLFANGVTTYKWATISAAGIITDGADAALDSVPAFQANNADMSTLSFVDGQVVGTTGKIQMRRTLGLSKVASVTVDLDEHSFDTGEVVSYTNSTDSRVIQFFFVDEQGRLNWMFTSALGKLTNVRWNGVAGGGSLPDGVTVTSVSTKYITTGAATVTITGTRLNTNTDTGGKFSIGSSQVAALTRSATKIVVTVPAGTTAGDIQINGTYGGSGATLAIVTRIASPTKQSQTIDDTQDLSATWSGVGSKTTATFPAATDKGLATTIKVDKAAICSVSGQTVTMNAAGTCVVTVASAGDLGTAAVSQTTTIVVAKRDKGNVSAIVSAVTAAGGAWAGSNIVATIPSLLTSVGLNATVTVAPAAVCTLAGAVLTIKAAGTCAVSVTGAADAGTDAIAKTVTNVVVTKGDLALTVDSTLAVTNNPADISGNDLNVRQISVDVADAAASLVDFTYASNNEDICTVDEDGNVTGVAVGTCTITTDADAGANWDADEKTTTVTVGTTDTAIDVLPEEGDGQLAPKSIANNKTAFVATNDASLLVKWDKVAGLLTLQSKGIYIGFIKAEFSFTKNETSYTCTNVFGTTTAMASKTAAQKKASLKTKVFTAAAAACKDASGLFVPDSITAVTDFAKIKKSAKVAGTATTAGTTKYEAAAQLALKGFVGNVTIKVTRYRAWPTTMKNKAGHTATGKGIPATVRNTVISLQ